jgi:hypothetical protein
VEYRYLVQRNADRARTSEYAVQVDKSERSTKDSVPLFLMAENTAMAFEEQDDKTIYLVLINCEEQYSLWPKHIAVPRGWKD